MRTAKTRTLAQGLDAKRGADGKLEYVEIPNTAAVSVFDPCLTELLVRWFSKPNGAVIDPFAGGSVRGLVACRLGRKYTGIELRAEQVEANREQSTSFVSRRLLDADNQPQWITGDSRRARDLAPKGQTYDMMLTCPPYYDLEVYSDDPADISNADSYADFLTMYGDCLGAASALCAPESFAAIVIAEVRDKRGAIQDLPGDTTRLMQGHGWYLYNAAVLVTPAGSLPIRTTRAFTGTRKMGRTHQSVLVYYKGDPGKIANLGPVEMGEPEVYGTEEDE